MDTILKLLEENAQLTAEQLAVMLGKSEEEVKAAIKRYEDEGVIRGYTALVDWDKTDREYVSAIIEIKVTPQRDRGYDRLAEKIINYPEVKSIMLVSGGFDLLVTIEGKTLKEVAYFVANKLAPMEGVLSTATHFVLKKYKDKGIVYGAPEVDERGNIM